MGKEDKFVTKSPKKIIPKEPKKLNDSSSKARTGKRTNRVGK